MAHTQRLTVRFDDVDFARVVYFPRLFGYCHQVFEDFFGSALGVPYARMLQDRKVGFPVVHTSADFRAPFRFGDEVRVVMETLKVGKSAITCRYRLHLGDAPEVGAEIKVVAACIGMDSFSAVEVPPDVRALFEQHLVREG